MPQDIALVVDSDKHFRDALTMPLMAWGYRIQEAADYSEATAIVSAVSDVQCVLLGASLSLTEVRTIAEHVTREFGGEVAVLAQFTESNLTQNISAVANLVDDFFLRTTLLPELRVRLQRAKLSVAERRRFRRLQDIAERQGSIDPETGLMTHRLITERLEQEISRCKRNGRQLSVLLLKMAQGADEYRLESQSVGRNMFSFARRIADSVRRYDITGRLDAAQIMVVLPETDSVQLSSAVIQLKGKLSSSQEKDSPYMFNVIVGGISVSPTLNCRAADLTARAEEAMHAAELHPDQVCLVLQACSGSEKDQNIDNANIHS